MIQSLQSLRFIFVTLIFVGHFTYGMSATDALGDGGVAFFFMLSGFILSKSYENKVERGDFRLKPFVISRWKKFYPAHLLMVAVFILVNLKNLHADDYLRMIPAIFLVQSWIPDKDFYFAANSVSWFLSSLTFAYLAFSTLLRIMQVRQHVFTVAILVSYILATYLVPATMVNKLVYVNPLFRIVDFILGMYTFQCYKKLKPRLKATDSTLKSSLKECLAIAIAALPFLLYTEIDEKVRTASIFWLPFFTLIIIFSLHEGKGGIFTKLLKNNTLVYFGNISFMFYIIHQVIINVLHRTVINLQWNLSVPMAFILFFATTILLSSLLHKWFARKKTIPEKYRQTQNT